MLKDLGTFWDQMKLIIRDVININPIRSRMIIIGKIIGALLPLVQLYLIKALIDEITGNTQVFSMLELVGFFGLTQIVISFLNQYTAYLENALQQETNDHFASIIIKKTTELDYAMMEEPKFQNTLFLAQQQARIRVNQLLPTLYNSGSALLSLIFLILLFMGLKAYFFLLIALFAIPITLQKWFLGKKNTDLEFRLAPKERESHYLFQVLTGLPWAKESRTYGLGSPFLLKFKEIRKYIASEKDIILKKGIKESLIIDLLEIAFTACILFYLSNMALRLQISLGIFILYLQGIQRMQATSKTLFQSLLQMFQLRTFVRDLYAFLQIPTIQQISKQKKINPIYDLRIENLGFRYPNIERPILSNINLSAKKGQVIAIVGENGSGKSTLVKILAGLYKQQEGKVLLNGISAEEDYWLNWHKAAQFLFQDFQQYQMTVEGNIHFVHNPTESETEQAIEAAKKSGAHPFVVNLADQYQTELGNLQKNSVQLSGGQWQKLALSRLFNRPSEIIVLDEPSSSLDAFAESNLYGNIRKSFAENIVILISHRLYNLKMADKIYVMKDGRIEDEGTFHELISKEGVFLNLYQNQKI